MMTSLWLTDRTVPHRETQIARPPADVVVVGAGITGLITAALLARAGKDVLVLEARTAGVVTTGNTTGKISLLQTTCGATGRARTGCCVTATAMTSRSSARRMPTPTPSPRGRCCGRAELAACRLAGLDAQWDPDAGVPFPYHGGVRLADQAQFDPMPLLDKLISELVERGGRLVENARVQRLSQRSGRVRLGAWVSNTLVGVFG
jgi:glycine/D-amino acid oxidase-like deaminating enzyme